MKSARDETIFFEAEVERIAPELPRFVVYPGKAWDEKETFIVDVVLNGVSIGLRSLIPWKERSGWNFGLSQPMCSKAGIETGDRVRVEMRRTGDALPDELRELLKSDPRANNAWKVLPARQRRDFILFVAGAKKPETRMRRAKRLVRC